MRTTPTTALIAVIASAGGLLVGWYSPAPVLPALVFGVLAYVGTVLLLAKVLRLDRDKALLGTSRCVLLAAALTLQAVLRACINGLNALSRWDTIPLARTGATAP
jgi:hypothetical protein